MDDVVRADHHGPLKSCVALADAPGLLQRGWACRPDSGDVMSDALTSAVKTSQCVLFVGAGIHAGPPATLPFEYPEAHRPPLGRVLARKLATEHGMDRDLPKESPDDLQRVSLFVEMRRSRKQLVDSLIREVSEGKRPSPALRMLAEMPFTILVTTNFDDLLETALRDAGKKPVVLVYDPTGDRTTRDVSEDPTPDRPLVFKMHGDINDRASIVVTDEDYINFIQRMSADCHPVPQTVMFRMSRWSTIFIGYSLRDYNLRLLFRTLRLRSDPANSPPTFSIDPRPDPLILELFERRPNLVTFVVEDVWDFVPKLHATIASDASAP